MKIPWTMVWKVCIAILWFGLLISLFIWMDRFHITFRELPRILRGIIRQQGAWGPLVILVLYVFRSFTFVPVSVLTVVAGTLYGPFLGSLLNILGENLSAAISFFLGRFFGRNFVQAHETAWLKKYDELLTKDGFFPVMLMRFLLFPFDVVSIGSGMTGIPFRTYMLATFVGLMPALIAFTVLGNVYNHPHSIGVFVVFFGILLAVMALLVRHPRVRRHLGRE